MEVSKENYSISTDKNKLDVLLIYNFLTNESGWSDGISYDVVKVSIENSLNFGLYHNEKQIGFARVISDYATIAYLGDIFILKEYRKLGLSKWLMETIMGHPNLQNLRRWILLTSTAKWLYEKYGFTKLPKPEIYMEKFNPNVYNETIKG
ncbi:GNAT superfamily N-acetyltransferase [Aquimarina sp. EL_43]|uniref:GNAT family N-acetyltransferase n=1 Tax=unclassified Aquimarina TaxID=2627091 RepID=UPI0018CA163D|nr:MULTISPECIES: GNAT family N-acetyltransferase [unclassified Aquimarina]MBG6132867.1 GNAT superfamily N-acetyltransferase [Aquimarina sp. EL_35]MBG6153056.1 GNAT superfamily N-acetyltransferase [Aquimarina sp. EL_32]MBG6171212.1 GNAT superfamily N-acetyltransferase [Aquimarina sp. EL_43]